ncbi:MAG: hypothetical protein AB1531_00935 [Chloroflexota bacterium]
MRTTLSGMVCGLLLLALAACNIPVPTPTAAPVPSVAPLSTPEGPVGWLTYTDTYAGFSIQYPPDGTLYLEAMTRIDLPIAPDTNLGEKYLQIAYGSLASPCLSSLGAGWAPGTIPQTPVTFNGVDFILEEGSDAGAGNIYEWVAYSVSNGSICISLEFVLHSTNPAHYDIPPAVYDYAAESAVFEQMMNTFLWLP